MSRLLAFMKKARSFVPESRSMRGMLLISALWISAAPSALAQTQQYWDGSQTTANNLVDGGAGTWSTATNWTNSGGTVNSAWSNGSVANLINPPTTSGGNVVTVAGTPNIRGINFNNDSAGYYRLLGGTLIGIGSPTVITTNSSNPSFETTVLSGGAYEFNIPAGKLILLQAANTFSGTVDLKSGRLRVEHTNALGTTGAGTTVRSGASLHVLVDGTSPADPLTISGFGSETNYGALTLEQDTSYAGPITLGANASIAGGSATGKVTNTVNNAGYDLTTVTQFSIFSLTFTYPISGSGGLIKTGSGTTILSGANTYAGATTVSAGKLNVGAGGTAGSIDSNSGTSVASGALLKFNRSDAYSSTKVISGAGNVEQAGVGTTTLSAANTYTGATTVSAGTLVAANATALGTTAGATTIASNASLGLSGGISIGAEALTLSGSGASGSDGALYNVSGANTYGGAVTLGAASTIGSTAGTLTLSGTVAPGSNALTLAGAGNVTANGVINGTGTLTKQGTGTATLAAANTYTGATTVSAGTLQVGAGGTAGSIDSNSGTSVASSALLKFNRSDAYGSTKVISGAGNVEQAGAGTTTLSAANTYAGATTVSAGKLVVTGSTAGGATTVASGATLGGTGTLNNTVTVQNGGILAPGLSPGTITTNGLVLNSGSVLNMELGQAGTPGGSLNDLVQVNGNLTLSGGTLNIAQSSGGTFGPGTYRLINYTGSCGGCAAGGLTLGTLPSGVSASQVTIDYNIVNSQINLIVAAPQQYWDGPAANNRQGATNTPVDHPHNFVAGTSGSLALGIAVESANASSANASWNGTIHADPGCTGKVQSGATQLYPGSTTVQVVQGQTVCVVVRELAPAGTDNGTVNQTTVWATLSFTNANPTLSTSYTLVDTTTVGNSALVLLKEVRNVTTGGAWGTSNQAKSGQVLEYRVTYTNATTSPMTKVTIGDSAPAYTVFQSATAGTVPSDLGTCTMNTPANPAPAAAVGCATVQSVGGTGAIRWLFDGRLNPGASGDVGFKVKVE